MLSNAFVSISSWRSYKATPLIGLNKLQKNLKLNNIFYKDESKRFGLKSFKALGGAYAVEKIVKNKKSNSINCNSRKSWKICVLGSKKNKEQDVKFLLVKM